MKCQTEGRTTQKAYVCRKIRSRMVLHTHGSLYSHSLKGTPCTFIRIGADSCQYHYHQSTGLFPLSQGLFYKAIICQHDNDSEAQASFQPGFDNNSLISQHYMTESGFTVCLSNRLTYVVMLDKNIFIANKKDIQSSRLAMVSDSIQLTTVLLVG